TLKLPYVAIAMQQGDALQTAETYGRCTTTPQAFALSYQGAVIGQLLVATRAADEAFTAQEERLLQNIARQAGTAVHALQLTGDLQNARQQVVTSREEERRRLRRDLHDGLGPVLASQGLKLAAARQLIREKPEVAERLLDEVMRQGEATVTEVRRLVYALRPPTLDELGLVEAIREHVDTAGSGADLQIVVIAPDTLPEIPAAIEVAAFRIVQEALNNVIRHARAHRCSITIALDDALHIAIEDDGIGLTANARSGVGLHSMRERALEVGGDCVIENGARQGLAVRVTLPVAK
ncbi:MAG: sensor histidine kinase, partial [Caldilinea sp.]|nr:sensor histidine kinase [Caldilinea sp.]